MMGFPSGSDGKESVLIPNLLIYPPSPFAFGNYKFVFEVCESVSVL